MERAFKHLAIHTDVCAQEAQLSLVKICRSVSRLVVVINLGLIAEMMIRFAQHQHVQFLITVFAISTTDMLT